MQTALKLSSQAIIISHNFVLYKPQLFSVILFYSGNNYGQFTYFHFHSTPGRNYIYIFFSSPYIIYIYLYIFCYSTPGRSFDVREPKDRLVSSREGEVFFTILAGTCLNFNHHYNVIVVTDLVTLTKGSYQKQSEGLLCILTLAGRIPG